MAKNHIIRFRVTKIQHEQLIKEAKSYGHIYLSDYIREIALKRPFRLETQIIETNNKVKEILCLLKDGKRKQNTGMDENT